MFYIKEYDFNVMILACANFGGFVASMILIWKSSLVLLPVYMLLLIPITGFDGRE